MMQELSMETPVNSISVPLLELRNLSVQYFGRRGTVHAVRGLDLAIKPGETLGLVGESGSGKSATAAAIMGVLQPPGLVTGGDILWKGESMISPEAKQRARRLRGKSVSMIFQDPMRSLDPLSKVGTQISEVLRLHLAMSRRDAAKRSVELLRMVGISAPERRIRQYPHELSGGMRQRVMIAIALACSPDLVIADEPTTALDVTVQLQIVQLLKELQQELGMAILMISHDLGLIAETCDRVAVLYAGRACEVSDTETLFANPSHPYTVGLLNSTPRLDLKVPRLQSIPGAAPTMVQPPKGCAFHARCPIAESKCLSEIPDLMKSDDSTGSSACWFQERVRQDIFDPRLVGTK